jgi:hypothetical protein
MRTAVNVGLSWHLVLASLIGALTLLWVAFRLAHVVWAAKTLPEAISDVRRNWLVGLGWLLVVASVPVGMWAWCDLRSVPMTAAGVVSGVIGVVLATYLPYRDEVKRGE